MPRRPHDCGRHATRRSHVLFSHWPIRNKLQLGLGLLAVSVLTLFGSAYYGLYAYRGLVKSLSARSAELPLANKLRDHVADLHEILNQVQDRQELDDEVRRRSLATRPTRRSGTTGCCARDIRDAARPVLPDARPLPGAARHQPAAHRIAASATTATSAKRSPRSTTCWPASSSTTTKTAPTGCSTTKPRSASCATTSKRFASLAAELPSHLHERLPRAGVRRPHAVSLGDLRWPGSTAGSGDDPAGGRRAAVPQVDRPAAGDARAKARAKWPPASSTIAFSSIRDDEMGELAEAMNAMTARFQEIRDDLDCQVRERTKQVVRSEQLASVGFLAAGVAHEINNPLASIAMCSESLEGRLSELAEPRRRRPRGRPRRRPQLPRNDSEGSLSLQANHREAARLLAAWATPSGTTPTCASWWPA